MRSDKWNNFDNSGKNNIISCNVVYGQTLHNTCWANRSAFTSAEGSFGFHFISQLTSPFKSAAAVKLCNEQPSYTTAPTQPPARLHCTAQLVRFCAELIACWFLSCNLKRILKLTGLDTCVFFPVTLFWYKLSDLPSGLVGFTLLPSVSCRPYLRNLWPSCKETDRRRFPWQGDNYPVQKYLPARTACNMGCSISFFIII